MVSVPGDLNVNESASVNVNAMVHLVLGIQMPSSDLIAVNSGLGLLVPQHQP